MVNSHMHGAFWGSKAVEEVLLWLPVRCPAVAYELSNLGTGGSLEPAYGTTYHYLFV